MHGPNHIKILLFDLCYYSMI